MNAAILPVRDPSPAAPVRSETCLSAGRRRRVTRLPPRQQAHLRGCTQAGDCRPTLRDITGSALNAAMLPASCAAPTLVCARRSLALAIVVQLRPLAEGRVDLIQPEGDRVRESLAFRHARVLVRRAGGQPARKRCGRPERCGKRTARKPEQQESPVHRRGLHDLGDGPARPLGEPETIRHIPVGARDIGRRAAFDDADLAGRG